jgi:hypothetical protein
MGRDPDTYYPKYLVIRRSNCEVVDPTTCFTLIPSHDLHAKVALEAYCDSCEAEMPGLPKALREALL